MPPRVRAFFHKPTSSLTYVISDPSSGRAAILDPVLDYGARSGRTATHAADEVLAHVRAEGLTVEWVLETHVHADHLSAAGYLKGKLGAKLGIGAHVVEVQRTWAEIYNIAIPTDGSQFDRRFADGDALSLGAVEIGVMHTPGHTPACIAYVAEGVAFVGDTLFMPDFGTARCDFPGGDAHTLYRSIRRILSLSPETRVHVCHDYQPNERPVLWEASVKAHREGNLHVHDGVSEDAFARLRTTRDKDLSLPKLLLPAVQVNIRGGVLPEPEANGRRYLKIPLDRL